MLMAEFPDAQECFVCSACGSAVSGGFVMRNGRPVCANCAKGSTPQKPQVAASSPQVIQGTCRKDAYRCYLVVS